jgi:hypothetical protein
MLVCAVAVVLAGMSVVRSLASAEWDPTLYAAFGEEATATRVFAEERLGPVYLRDAQGHDGKFFFVQAHDPFLIDPETNASVLDLPAYRSQRMLYPLLAGGAGLFSSSVIVWAMIVVNIAALGVGTWATARVATHMGMSPWWGLSFALNPGLISELNIGGSGLVAAAAAFCALAFIQRGGVVMAACLLALGSLSRESMVVVALGVALWVWRFGSRRRDAILLAAVPAASVAFWAAYVGLRLGPDGGAVSADVLGVPFVGFLNALDFWTDDPIGMAVGIFIVVLIVAFIYRALRSRLLVGYAFMGLAALGLLASARVWLEYFDITRAIAPVFTAYVLMLFAPQVGKGGSNDEAPIPMEQGTTST